MRNNPYVKQYDENGRITNPIVNFFQSCNNAPFEAGVGRGENPFPSVRMANSKTRKKNNRKQHGTRVQVITHKKVYDKAGDLIGYKSITPKVIIHR